MLFGFVFVAGSGSDSTAPFKLLIVLQSLLQQVVREKLLQVGVVWLVFEAKGLAVGNICCENWRAVFAQLLHVNSLLFLQNLLILLLFGLCLQALPRQHPAAEIEQDVAQGLHVIAATLLGALVGIDRGVSGCSRQAFSLTEGNVLTLGVAISLRQAEVDNVNGIAVPPSSHKEIVWLQVSVNEVLRMEILDP